MEKHSKLLDLCEGIDTGLNAKIKNGSYLVKITKKKGLFLSYLCV